MKATENGAIELKSGTYKVVKEYEQRYERPDNSVYVYSDIVRSDEGGNIANNGTIRNQREQVEGSGQTGSKGLQSDSSGNDEHLRTSNRGVNESGKIKKSQRDSAYKNTENRPLCYKSGTYKVVKNFERQYKEPDNGIYVHIEAMRSYQTGGATNNNTTRNGAKYVQSSGQVGSEGLQSNTPGNDEHLRTSNRGVSDSNGVKMQERCPLALLQIKQMFQIWKGDILK